MCEAYKTEHAETNTVVYRNDDEEYILSAFRKMIQSSDGRFTTLREAFDDMQTTVQSAKTSLESVEANLQSAITIAATTERRLCEGKIQALEQELWQKKLQIERWTERQQNEVIEEEDEEEDADGMSLLSQLRARIIYAESLDALRSEDYADEDAEYEEYLQDHTHPVLLTLFTKYKECIDGTFDWDALQNFAT